MSNMDFNAAEPQREFGALIPDGTIVLVVASLRPGQAGPGGWLKASQTGAEMADFEFTIDGGEYDRRKVWANWVTSGITDGHEKASNITRSRLRAMLESAYGIHPGDDSPDALAKRQVSGWQNFDGLKFCAKIGVETGGLKDKTAGPQSERYPDKNTLTPVTPDDQRYIASGPQQAGFKSAGAAVQSAAKAAGGGTAKAVATAAKPAWAS